MSEKQIKYRCPKCGDDESGVRIDTVETYRALYSNRGASHIPEDATARCENCGYSTTARDFWSAAHPVFITMEGGLIHSVENIPAGVVIEVRDFDTDGVDEDRLHQDDDGDDYVKSTYTHGD